MNAHIKHVVLLNLLMAGASVMQPERAAAQVLTTLIAFNPNAGYDPGNPYGGLIVSSNTLFGTALYHGYSAYGAVFRINTDGTATRRLDWILPRTAAGRVTLRFC